MERDVLEIQQSTNTPIQESGTCALPTARTLPPGPAPCPAAAEPATQRNRATHHSAKRNRAARVGWVRGRLCHPSHWDLYHPRGSPGYRCDTAGDSSLPKQLGPMHTCGNCSAEPANKDPDTRERTLRSSEALLAPGPPRQAVPTLQAGPGSGGTCCTDATSAQPTENTRRSPRPAPLAQPARGPARCEGPELPRRGPPPPPAPPHREPQNPPRVIPPLRSPGPGGTAGGDGV